MCRIGFFWFSITNLNWCSIIHWPCKHQNNWSQSLEGGVVKKMHIFNDNCNEYYCIYCENKHSNNAKRIEDHNNSLFHAWFVKLQ
jgi:hypothetical protein